MANLEYIGALWKPRSDNPRAPLASGNIKFMGREIRITVWDNQSRKRPDKRDPDYKITLDAKRDEQPPERSSDPPF